MPLIYPFVILFIWIPVALFDFFYDLYKGLKTVGVKRVIASFRDE
jgi:hypothetical protein